VIFFPLFLHSHIFPSHLSSRYSVQPVPATRWTSFFFFLNFPPFLCSSGGYKDGPFLFPSLPPPFCTSPSFPVPEASASLFFIAGFFYVLLSELQLGIGSPFPSCNFFFLARPGISKGKHFSHKDFLRLSPTPDCKLTVPSPTHPPPPYNLHTPMLRVPPLALNQGHNTRSYKDAPPWPSLFVFSQTLGLSHTFASFLSFGLHAKICFLRMSDLLRCRRGVSPPFPHRFFMHTGTLAATIFLVSFSSFPFCAESWIPVSAGDPPDSPNPLC